MPTTKSGFEPYHRYFKRLEGFSQKPKNQVYTSAIFSFLAISLFGWYAVRPTLQTILLLRREIEENKIINERLEEKITKLIEAQATYQNIQDQLPLLSQSLPEKPEAAMAVAQIRNLTNESGASISAVTVSSGPLVGSDTTGQKQELKDESPPSNSPQKTSGPTKPLGKNLSSVPVAVSITGTYTTIHSTLQNILAMRRLVTIENMTLLKNKEVESSRSSSNNVLRLVLKLSIYFLPP